MKYSKTFMWLHNDVEWYNLPDEFKEGLKTYIDTDFVIEWRVPEYTDSSNL